MIQYILTESFIESSSDTDTEEQKISSDVGSPIVTGPRTYYYQCTGGKPGITDARQDKDSIPRLIENSSTSFPRSNISIVQKSISLIATNSNIKTNTTGNHSARQTKKHGANRSIGNYSKVFGTFYRMLTLYSIH